MRKLIRVSTALVASLGLAGYAQDVPRAASQGTATDSENGKVYQVAEGTKVPLTMINSVSTKNSQPGERVYLETAFPIVIGGKIVIPPGSYVAGTVMNLKRPGRVKGRGEMYLRFDSLTLPNGVTREFTARLGGIDGRDNGKVDKKEGAIKGDGDVAGDITKVAAAGATGTSIGVLAGAPAGSVGMGAGIGAGAGVAAGVMSVLLTRGPDVVLAKGSWLEMVLDQSLSFNESELDFTNTPGYRPSTRDSVPPPARRSATPARRLPL